MLTQVVTSYADSAVDEIGLNTASLSEEEASEADDEERRGEKEQQNTSKDGSAEARRSKRARKERGKFYAY